MQETDKIGIENFSSAISLRSKDRWEKKNKGKIKKEGLAAVRGAKNQPARSIERAIRLIRHTPTRKSLEHYRKIGTWLPS